MSDIRLSAYRIMWIFVFFDLPVGTKLQRKHAALFRKWLECDGFTMMQYSVYTRFCGSYEVMQVHIRRVKSILPVDGHVVVLSVTDRQYSNIYNFYHAQETGKKQKAKQNIRPAPIQLELF